MTDSRWPPASGRLGKKPAHRVQPARFPSATLVAIISVLTGTAILVFSAGTVTGLLGDRSGQLPVPTGDPAPQPRTGDANAQPPPLFTKATAPATGTAADSPAAHPTRHAAEPNTDPLVLGSNPINASGLSAPRTLCSLPHFDSSDEGQSAFYQAALTCLNATGEPMLRAANLPFDDARVKLVTRETPTPCGTRAPTQTALYCAGTLYMTGSYYRDIEGHGNNTGVYFGQLAHEYGHHLQELAGITDAFWALRDRSGNESPAGYEISRRFELQATCYGGMFLAAARNGGSVPHVIIEQALTDAELRGDYEDSRSPDHGRPELNAAWVWQGYTKNATYQCNTWLADPRTVG